MEHYIEEFIAVSYILIIGMLGGVICSGVFEWIQQKRDERRNEEIWRRLSEQKKKEGR
jgi:hypothetical protein